MLPSKSRDQWYIDHGDEIRAYLELLDGVKVGMTKKEVLLIAGEPTYKRTEDVLRKPTDEWIYAHRYFLSRYYRNIRCQISQISGIKWFIN